ncbi:MAG: hypothetical protein VB081_00640 [Christensenella sp.]|uniref:hypothetical protein n=1 Tax=Christensenella sp. TaxID=1935934 RepID=UPI002B1F43DD|nr:hypothetical protein [Christensenella sp.]MEA5001996.1 hypothetical protein [Christensenella sp.]
MVEISLSILLLAGAFALIMAGIAIKKVYWQPEEEPETVVKGFESDEDERTKRQIANVLNYGKPGYKQQEIDNDED